MGRVLIIYFVLTRFWCVVLQVSGALLGLLNANASGRRRRLAETDVVFEGHVALRSSLLASTIQAGQTMELTSTSLQQQASSVLSIVSAPSEVSTSSQDSAAQFLSDLAAKGNSTAVGAMTASLSASLGSALSNLVDSGLLGVGNLTELGTGPLNPDQQRALSNSLLVALTLKSVSAAQLIGALPGMSPKEVVTENIQVSRRACPCLCACYVNLTLVSFRADVQSAGQSC